eukprot:COSAG02_NODE_4187_length_5649_cov_4.270811_3_plen_80_part_00
MVTAALADLNNPIKAGWMYKEGHRRKTFKKRYFVVWPKDFREMFLDAPVLFYYDSDQGGEVRLNLTGTRLHAGVAHFLD